MRVVSFRLLYLVGGLGYIKAMDCVHLRSLDEGVSRCTFWVVVQQIVVKSILRGMFEHAMGVTGVLQLRDGTCAGSLAILKGQ